MTKNNNTPQNVFDAKRSIKAHIKFFESLIKHINGNNEPMRHRAMFAAWCLHEYINTGLINDMEQAMLNSLAANDPE